MAKRVSLMLRMQRWADEHNTEPINWEDSNQYKYTVYYNYLYKRFEHGRANLCRNIFSVYFTSKELAEQAIEAFGDKIKEVLGV